MIQSQSQSYVEDLEFSPPLDIHWVWHVHMLAPQHYQHDLLQSPLGRIINHEPCNPGSVKAKTKRARTASAWRKLYPDEPFEIDVLATEHGSEFSSSFTYDIVTASSRQKVFFYQVGFKSFSSENKRLHFSDQACVKQFILSGLVATVSGQEFSFCCSISLLPVLVSQTKGSRQVSSSML